MLTEQKIQELKEKIRAACTKARENGYTIRRRVTLDTHLKTCCALGAVVLTNEVLDYQLSLSRLCRAAAILGLPSRLDNTDEIDSFIVGFDNLPEHCAAFSARRHLPEYVSLGREIAAEFVDEAPVNAS